MKILQVVPDLNLAGAQTMCENLILEQKKDNIVEIICLYNNNSPIIDRLRNNNINIHFLNKRRGIDFSIIKKIRSIVNLFEPDVIHTHRYVLEYVIPAIKKCNKKNISIIHTVHNLANKEVPWYLQILQKKWFKKGIVVPIAISEKIQESIVDRYDMNKNDVPIIYNGINLDLCNKKNDYSFKNKIVHIGRFSEQKNHEELIEIFNEVLKINKELKLYLVGVGELQQNIRNMVNELNIEENVIFLGEISDCYDILNESDIFVLSSKWEGMPMTLIEAMGTGLPCIAYPVGGIKDMINDGENGFIPTNKLEFCNCIIQLCNDKITREKFGKNAIESSNIYSSKEMASKYDNIYKKGIIDEVEY